MNSAVVGVVAGVVVFAIGGVHGLLVLAVAIVSWWIVRSFCIWLLAQQNEGAKQGKASALKILIAQRRFAIILALLVIVLAATLATYLGDFSGFDSGETAQRTSSPLAAFGWLLLVLAPLALVSWVFVQAGKETRRRQAEQEDGERERQEAAHRREAEKRAAEERAAEERQAEERRRQTEQEHEAERRTQHERDRAAKQLYESTWWTVLEISPHASADEIRRAYHRKIKQCHPDRVAGLAPEFVELAERHTRTLNAAYEKATRARGGNQAA